MNERPGSIAVERQELGRILIVDPDEGIARTLAAILRHEGHEATTSATLRDAVSRLHAHPFDVVLADLRVGDDDGKDILSHIRQSAPDTVVIVLTTYASFESALRALPAGAYGYLLKPVDIEELRPIVRRALEHCHLQRELADHVRELEVAHKEMRTFNTRLQEQVDEATAELQRKVQALDDANHQLRQAQEEHDRFVAMVAHEMRGPLSLVINFAQLVQRPDATPEAIERYTNGIVEHAFRLDRLVDDLQTATRLSTGHFTLRRERCDVTGAVGEVIDYFVSAVHERHFSYERPDDPVFAEVDRDRVVQAVRNLIDNAVKYSVDGGAVEVRVWQDTAHVYIRVRDYGAGIPEAEMPRIFEAFTRLQQQHEVAGSGLGLFITRGIVAAHGGELAVRNGTGTERARGAVFTIELPLRVPGPAGRVGETPVPPRT